MSIADNHITSRENARKTNGEFGRQERSEPESALTAAPSAEEVKLERAIESLRGILTDEETFAHAADDLRSRHINTWRPDLIYVHYDESLDDESTDDYLAGNLEALDGLEENWRDSEAYDDAVDTYARELVGSDTYDELDDDTRDELRYWIQDNDSSDPLPQMVSNKGAVLMQLPATADDYTFASALSNASLVDGEEAKMDALRAPFREALTTAGIELDEHNTAVIDSLIVENNLEEGFIASEQWTLRLVVHARPAEVALTSFDGESPAQRSVSVTDPYLMLVDRHNGRMYEEKLSGTFSTTLTKDNPARVDSVLGYGSIDEIAGVVKSAFRADIATKEAA